MWYTANVLFRSERSGKTSAPALWEESILLIEAASEEDAHREAERIGSSRSHSYESGGGRMAWIFERIELR